MEFTEQDYENRKDFVKGLFSLGELSEIGKSAAEIYFDSIGIKRMKIIAVEKEMMIERNYQFAGHPSEQDFTNIYAKDTEKVFKEFLYRLLGKMQEENIHYALIEVYSVQN